MPAAGTEASEQGVGGGLLVEVKGLRVVGGGEALDLVGGEVMRPELARLAEGDPVEGAHGTFRRRKSMGCSIHMTRSPA